MPDSDKIEFGSDSDMTMYHDDTNAYITNSKGALKIADQSSGIAISIGHTTSEVTVNDNLTVTGDLTVNGTTTSVNQVEIDVTNAFVFEGSSADAHETTLGIVDPTADATINLPAMANAGSPYYLPVLAAVSTTAISSTPEELNILDGVTATATELNYLDITTLGTAENSKAFTRAADGTATFAGTTIADLGTVTTADINGGTIDGAIIGGASAAAGTFAALTATGTVTFGVDDTGVDVRLYSATASEGVLYDASEDELALLLTTKLKFHDVGGDEEIFASANGHLEVNAGTTLDMTAPTVDINASTAVTIDGPALTVADSADGKPVLTLKTTHTTKTSSGELQFLKDAADTEDGEVLGQITFYGEDEGNNNTAFAKMVAEISESDEGDEAGKLSFYVAESDSTTTALAAGLVLEGEHATDGEVDVTIGAGTASTTTVAGTLTMGSTAALTNAGLVAVANQSNITGLGTIGTGVWQGTAIATAYIADDAITGAKIALFDDSLAATTTHFLIADGTDYSSFALSGDVTCTNGGVVSIAANAVDGTHIALGSDAQGDIMYYDGTNWARLGYGTSGQFLKTQGSSANPVWASSSTSTVEVITNAGVTVSKAYTAITTGGVNRTATMPEATSSEVGDTYTIKKVDAGSGNVSVTAEGDGLIDGGASTVLYHQNESVTVVCRAADVWDII